MSDIIQLERKTVTEAPRAKGLRPKGPQLFVDWRYVFAGDNVYIGGGKTLRNWKTAVPGTIPKPDSALGIRLEAQAGEPVGPLFQCDKPWESAYVMYVASIIHENGVYRMWYGVTPGDHADGTATWGVDVGLLLCYAESTDGLNWTKPNLGLFNYQGSTDNNIVYGREINNDGYSSGAVFKDDSAPESERYKLFYKGRIQFDDDATYAAKVTDYKAKFGEENIDPVCLTKNPKDRMVYGMFGAVSPDGIRWTPLGEPLLLHYSDTLNNVHLNPKDGSYVAFLRMRRGGRRIVGRAETKDFRCWPKKPEVVLEAPLSAHPGDDVYHGVVVNYPEGSDTHLMFATMFRQLTDGRHVELASSMDGKYWSLLPGERVVEPGDFGDWTGGDTHVGHGIFSLPDGRTAIPFVGYTEAHKAPRYLGKPHGAPGLVVWEKNRLSAIVADEVGEFRTKDLVFEGSGLAINCKTTYTGSVLVELRDASNEPVPGFTFADCDVINRNSVEQRVTWRGDGDISAYANQTVSFAFRLRCAKLYTFELV